MNKPTESSQPNRQHTRPSKEVVRAWMAQRRKQNHPPPGIEQIRAQLNWR